MKLMKLIELLKNNKTAIIIGVIVALFILLIDKLVEKYFLYKKRKRIKRICIFHLGELKRRLVPSYTKEKNVFFKETKVNEIKTAWYVYDMLLNNIDVMDPIKFKKTMEFFDNYSTNIEQIKSRLLDSRTKPKTGSLTHATFNKLKNYLEAALSELKGKK